MLTVVIFLIKCVKVRWVSLWHNGSNFLRLNLGFLLQFKALIHFLICGLTFESLWFILGQTDYGIRWLTYLLKHLVVLLQSLLLFFCIVLSIIRLTLKRQRVEWILRVLLMENICITVLPIREWFLVSWFTENRLFQIIGLSQLLLFGYNLEILVGFLTSCS